MLSPFTSTNVGTPFDFMNMGPQAHRQIALETAGFLSEPSNVSSLFCGLRDSPDVALPYSHRTFSDIFDPEHGRLTQIHGGFANLQLQEHGRKPVSYEGLIHSGLRKHDVIPGFFGVSTDACNREHGPGAESRGVLPDLGGQEYNQMPVSFGFTSNPREREYEPMLNGDGFLWSHLSESGCSALPANRNQMATTLPSGLEYTGSVSSRLADPGSVTFTPQAIDSSVLVFDSSMRAMAQRQGNRKSQAAKDAARHLKRTGGACPRHKASKKKCRCRTTSRISKNLVAAGAVPDTPTLPEVSAEARGLTAVNHIPQLDPGQEMDDLDMTSAPPRFPETKIIQQLESPVSRPDDDRRKGKLLPDGIVEHRLVFTCPFLYVGCKFVAFSSVEWSVHLEEHGRCRQALPTGYTLYPSTAFRLG